MEFEKPLHVGAPNIGNKELFYKYTEGMFDRRWLTNHGKLVLQFEEELQNHLGVKHCIVQCNGTIALEIAIRALGLEGEVIVPSLTFIATVHALQWQGITPVFCDVDPETLCLDPSEVERRITPRTTGILGVHVFGNVCNTEALSDVAARHRLKLMFDAAHAFGNQHEGQSIGSFGECEVFSFHATKFLNSFEGGAIATDNDELAQKIRFMQNFGFRDWDDVGYVGTNGKMTEVCAAMGLANLKAIDGFLETNQRNFEMYAREIESIPGVHLRDLERVSNAWKNGVMRNNQYILVEIGEDFPIRRDALMERLHSENVLARRYFWPGCHRMEPYATLQPDVGMHLPITEAILERILLLPTGMAIDESTIMRIADLIRTAALR
ncbi:DegT/DnrJ/EryC1/StrS family aminotransferase [Pontiellaceae bacterium B1224]|nr:DegT/DnrJ/EryC1/StrS family aminotransferase [Pontiellaceae bacterium B1224]